eukprot:4595942-Amphidinium_carterae.1
MAEMQMRASQVKCCSLCFQPVLVGTHCRDGTYRPTRGKSERLCHAHVCDLECGTGRTISDGSRDSQGRSLKKVPNPQWRLPS